MKVPRLTRVDALARGDHWYLDEGDECYFLGEYTARAGFSTATNDLIINLKKPVSRKGRPEYKWKGVAIDRSVLMFRANLDPDKLVGYVAVPAPPSKRPDHPEYDDRMLQVVSKFCHGSALAYRELLITADNRQAAHASGNRPSPGDLRATIAVNPACTDPPPAGVLLFDDVLTTGCTFKACKAILHEAFGNIPVVGVFIARRAIPNPFDDEPA